MNPRAPLTSAALARLTKELAHVEPSTVDGCLHCFAEEDLVRLAGPLDEIPDDLVRRVGIKGLDHWGDGSSLYRRLTPRILAGVIAAPGESSLVAHRLGWAGCWTTWPERERDAVLNVCRGWWLDTLAVDPEPLRTVHVIEFLAATPLPFSTWLDLWNQQPPGPADAHAAEVCGWWLPEMHADDLNVGWADVVDISTELTRWTLDHGVRRLRRVTDDPVLWDSIAELRRTHGG
ncbi:MAG: hypothetical protein J2O46_00715 [Nocardioides sp.]|nr:hypothetical protein [Nocardioides sp.]